MLRPQEDPREYALKEKMLVDHLKPTSATETTFIKSIARHRWLVKRAILMQNAYFEAHKGNWGSDFTLLLRYQSINERAALRLFKLLLSLRKKMAQGKSGFVSQKPVEPLTKSKIYPEIADRWAHNTAVPDPKTGEYTMLKVLREREAAENQLSPA